MLERQGSSEVDSHSCFVNRSRQLISVTRDHLVRLNDMSTEVREMTERLFTDNNSSNNNRTSRRRSSVKLDSQLMAKRRSSKSLSEDREGIVTLKMTKRSQSKIRTNRQINSQKDNHDNNLLEVNGTSNIQAARSGFVGIEKQILEANKERRKLKENNDEKKKQGRNYFGYSSIDCNKFIMNEKGSAQHRKDMALFDYKLRSHRPILQLPQITLSTEELALPISVPVPRSSTPRLDSPRSGRCDAWNSRALIMFGNNYDKFSRNRIESVPFRCAAFNRQTVKQWY